MSFENDYHPNTKKVSHPIWPVPPLNPCAFCQYSNAIEYEYRVYSFQSERLINVNTRLSDRVRVLGEPKNARDTANSIL
jgi:hypothetical protein